MTLAKRYNKGKLRYGLLPNRPIADIVDVFTRGAHKYSVYKNSKEELVKGSEIPLSEASKYELVESGAENWRKGLPWMETMESVERHIADWKTGIDIDELGTKTLANAAWGLIALLEFYKTHPELDDRSIKALNPRKIGLDIDGVLANFTDGLASWFNEYNYKPNHWNDPKILGWFEQVKENAKFWKSLNPLTLPHDIPFEPVAYVTARSIDPKITQEWLDFCGYPKAALICVGHNESKIEAVKKAGIEIFVDDRYENFVELTNAGIFTYLFDQSYNRHYQVGHRRIKSLKEL